MSPSKKLDLGKSFAGKDGSPATGRYNGNSYVRVAHYTGSYGQFISLSSDEKHGSTKYTTPTDALELSFILFDFASEAGVVPKED